MNLLTDPWMDVFTVDGSATLGLLEVARNAGDILDITCGDPLEDAAILRMLMAADLVSDGNLTRWLESTTGRWDLFDKVAPFWQNPQLREHVGERTVSPAVTLPYRLAGNGATLLDHHHNECGRRLTPAEAARALISRQQFSVGGIQSFPESIFGLKSAKGTVAAGRPLAWVDAGNLADTLAANRRPGPTGTFHHSWPAGIRPGQELPQGGQADALTWQARSMLLIPDSDGYVAGVSITEGVRYGDDTDPELIPHTTYIQKKKSDPYTPRDVHISRPGWRQLLAAYADSAAPGVLSADLPPGTRIRLTGLASYQSRIDGPVTEALPTPQISRVDAARLDAAIDDARKYVVGRLIAAGRVIAPSASITGGGAWWQQVMPTDARLNSDAEPVVRAAVAAELSVSDAADSIRVLAERCVAEFADCVAATSPVAAVVATTPPAPSKEGAPTR
jgi:CRISPR-associated protein Cse1 (CRISPR_cse1)